eukprot:snap_masked-scaffold1672_size31643-processed-gene-0.3 protein:Tk11188 transcript:snap_masked-scaffold1672_size31643-processed-gene-0.3-mRNA-1 annotation:"cuticle protein 7"
MSWIKKVIALIFGDVPDLNGHFKNAIHTVSHWAFTHVCLAILGIKTGQKVEQLFYHANMPDISLIYDMTIRVNGLPAGTARGALVHAAASRVHYNITTHVFPKDKYEDLLSSIGEISGIIKDAKKFREPPKELAQLDPTGTVPLREAHTSSWGGHGKYTVEYVNSELYDSEFDKLCQAIGQGIALMDISSVKKLVSTATQTIFALLALAAVVLADNPPPPYRPAPAPYQPEPKYEEPAQYQYAYAVKDEYSQLDFNANEEREGYGTSGSYQVLLPDGRTQTVTYSVNGDSGYVADVQYAGEAKYEPYQPKPARKYPPPTPQYN